MFDWRTFILICLLFGAGFAGVSWIAPGTAKPSTVSSAPKETASAPPPGPAHPRASPQAPLDAPNADSGGSRPASTPRPQPEAKAAPQLDIKPQAASDGDPMRDAVVHAALLYGRSPCRNDVKNLYVGAATAYAEKLMRSAGCSAFPACRVDAARLEQVWRLNRTPSDRAAAEAMAAVNVTGGISERDFQGQVGRAVRVMAGSGFRHGPSCGTSSRTTTHTVRIRIRRR
jgi:hypothetical protein